MAGLLNPWFQLACAIALEVAGTLLLKLSDGFARWHWGVSAIVLYAICFWLMASVLKAIPVGVAYAIWSGVGIVAITAIGFLLFGEQPRALQLFFILLVIAGTAGLRLTTAG